jgi:hypothetical protein
VRLGYAKEDANYAKTYRAAVEVVAPQLPDGTAWLVAGARAPEAPRPGDLPPVGAAVRRLPAREGLRLRAEAPTAFGRYFRFWVMVWAVSDVLLSRFESVSIILLRRSIAIWRRNDSVSPISDLESRSSCRIFAAP